MGSLPISIPDEVAQSIEREADKQGMSVSEHVLQLLEKGQAYDELERKLEYELDRRAELQLQLRKVTESDNRS